MGVNDLGNFDFPPCRPQNPVLMFRAFHPATHGRRFRPRKTVESTRSLEVAGLASAVFEGLPETLSGKPSGCGQEVDSDRGGARYPLQSKRLAHLCTFVDKTFVQHPAVNRARREGPMDAVPLHSWPCG
jgi:hypothetical protein